MSSEKPIEWVINEAARTGNAGEAVNELLPPGISRSVRTFHRQIPGFKMSPLKSLSSLAQYLGLGGLWVKDESVRLDLNSFKVLGGSFAIYQLIKKRLGIIDRELTFEELMSPEVKKQLGEVTFAAATDGNHGRGVAWAATQLGFRSIIYVHEHTTRARIEAIEKNGAEVVVIKGTYDDAVQQINTDAQAKGWEVVSDTSWEGYEDIPRWVMQGYTSMMSEVQEQFAGQGIVRPTHFIVQAGVGALAASTIAFYYQLLGEQRPWTIVVEPSEAACLYLSATADDGKPHHYDGDLDTIMAGLACGDPSPLAWNILSQCADVFAKCPDYVAAQGMRIYAVPRSGDPFIVSGESGAVTLGALWQIMENEEARPLREKLNLGWDSEVLLINSEGNTDPLDFRRVVWEGGDPVPDAYKVFRESLE
jgi:diaminopropionate ammonia-lyase